MPFVQGAGGQIVNVPSQSGGLLGALFDPSVQGQRLENQQAQIKLNQETAYQNGLPTTDGTPDGPIDLNAIARTQIQNGDINGGVGLLSTALKMRLLNDPSNINNPTGQAGGGVSGSTDPVGSTPSGGAGGTSTSSSTSGSGVDPMDVYSHAIGAQESSNNYSALGPKQPNGDRAYGYHQVMGSNVGPWTQQVLGQAMSPSDFLNNPQAQNAVFKAKFGQYLQQTGNPADAASMWFSGRPMARAGNASDSLGMTVPSYVSKFLSGLGPASQALQGQGGQGSPSAAPTALAGGSPAPLISFGGGPAQQPAASSGGSSDGMPISDSQVMAARNRLTAAQDLDPSNLTTAQQQQLTADTGTVDRYTQQQNTPAAPASSASAASTMPPDVSAAVARLRTGQGTPDDKAAYLAWGQGQSGASSGTVNGTPSSAPAPTVTATDAAPGSAHPFGPSSNALTGSRTPLPSASPAGGVAPASAPAPQPGGFQPISFTGGAAPQGAAPASAAPPGGAAMPPDVSAAISRLRGGQGNAGDSALWGSYLKSQGQNGGAPAAPPPSVGGMGQGQGAPQPVLQSTQPQVSASNGPDLPYLQGKYATPGGGAQYVADLLDTSRRYGLAGEQQAAQAYVERAKQVQSDLEAVNKSRLDLQTHNAELTDQQKTYQQAVQQGFQGSALDYQNAIETQKATANAAGRNSVLTPGQKEYQQAVAGGFQGSETDYQAAAASQKAEATKQGDYLGGLPAEYAKAADTARATSDNVDQMLNAAQGFRMGAGAGVQQDARKALQGTLGFLGVSNPKLNDPTASYEDFGKMAGVLNRNAAQQVGGRTGVQEMQLIGSTLPSPEMSYDGFRTVASSLKGSADFTIAKQQAAQDWTADPSHRNSLSGFEASFNRNTSPAAFWLNRLKVDQPDLFRQTVQGLGQTTQGRALLVKAKAGMSWANSNGLFN